MQFCDAMLKGQLQFVTNPSWGTVCRTFQLQYTRWIQDPNHIDSLNIKQLGKGKSITTKKRILYG